MISRTFSGKMFPVINKNERLNVGHSRFFSYPYLLHLFYFLSCLAFPIPLSNVCMTSKIRAHWLINTYNDVFLSVSRRRPVARRWPWEDHPGGRVGARHPTSASTPVSPYILPSTTKTITQNTAVEAHVKIDIVPWHSVRLCWEKFHKEAGRGGPLALSLVPSERGCRTPLTFDL